MTGSTLYRRLPDGTWAAEREDRRAAGPVLGAGEDASSESPPDAGGYTPPDVGGYPLSDAALYPPPASPPPASPAQPTLATPPPAPRRRRRRLRAFLLVLLGLVAAYAAWLVFLLIHAGATLDSSAQLSAHPIADTPGQVWLLVGSDSRAGLTKKERKELHTGADEGSQRTDTIMLVHQQAGQDPTLVSIPRDSWVTIPAHTASDGSQVGAQHAKINAAYAYGGSALLAETIEYNTGLHVDHFMEIGMGGIVDLTDAVGGVHVCFDKAITDKNSGLDVAAGCQTLDGKTALAWVRMRYADPTGDLGRMQRQQQWVSLMIHRAITPGFVLNPARQWQLVNAGLDAITVDEGTGVLSLGRLGLGLRQIVSGNGEITSVPVDENDHWENGQWVLHWDQAGADQLFSGMGAGTPQAQSQQ